MRALLDTHAFVWWNDGDPRLSDLARETILGSDNEILLSAVTAWEIAIKAGKGLLRLPEPLADYVPSRMALDAMQPLPVEMTHALHVAALPRHHNDPFDRLLIAQAQVEGVPILTSDPNIARYDVEIVW